MMFMCITCRHDGPDNCPQGFLKHNADGKCRGYEKLKIYLCGKITGDANYRAKFRDAENRLYEAGFYPVNPAAAISESDWGQAMRKAVCLMLQCDGVALLPDWRESRGAKIEARLARDLGLGVRPYEKW